MNAYTATTFWNVWWTNIILLTLFIIVGLKNIEVQLRRIFNG